MQNTDVAESHLLLHEVAGGRKWGRRRKLYLIPCRKQEEELQHILYSPYAGAYMHVQGSRSLTVSSYLGKDREVWLVRKEYKQILTYLS